MNLGLNYLFSWISIFIREPNYDLHRGLIHCSRGTYENVGMVCRCVLCINIGSEDLTSTTRECGSSRLNKL